MNEFDDAEILADIQALDEALASANKSQENIGSEQESDILSNDKDSEDNDYFEYLCKNRYIDKSLNAYEINTRLIAGMTIAKQKLTVLLEECEQKIKLLDEKMMQCKTQLSSRFPTACSAGMPYFKDKNHFGAPKNYDTKLKESRGELFIPLLTKPSRWTAKDRVILLEAINNQAIESVLYGEFSRKINEPTSDNQVKKLTLPKNLNEMVGPLGEKEFDWHKISVMDFDGKHSPGECRAMWNVYLHPDIKKNEWTSAEDKKLLQCAKEYRYQNWDAITWKLGTNRSAYQCFIRYNTIKKVPSAGQRWTKQEDRYLMKVIETLRIGDYIPWTELSNHIRYRTKQQIYVRWMYRKAPHLRKGRFTATETSTLLKAVQKHGTNFCKIANTVMPQRTSIQLQQRYRTVTANSSNTWTLENDTKLINLQEKYHNNWSKIATHFRDKSRTQVRHRFTALLKYAEKGVTLESIPRKRLPTCQRKFLMNKKSGLSKTHNKITLRKKPVQNTVQICDIQLRLYEALCFPPSIIKCNDFSEGFYDIKQLTHNTKKLYNTLSLLNANLDISDISERGFLDYAQLNNKEKQLLFSLKEYVNVLRYDTRNDELVEKFRTQMFGFTSEVDENNFFIPPLPFDGYVKIKKIKDQNNTSIDYDLRINEKFIVDVPTHFSVTPFVPSFISAEEDIQFYKLGSTSNKASSKNNQLNTNSSISLEDDEQLRKETTSIDEGDTKTNTCNVILPNQATLLGLKNLLLWKLLYDYQDESRRRSESSFENERNSEDSTTDYTREESVEYQLLRTRLLQLFKFPISLSNTILQVRGPERIFSETSESTSRNVTSKEKKTVPRKRKLADRNKN